MKLLKKKSEHESEDGDELSDPTVIHAAQVHLTTHSTDKHAILLTPEELAIAKAEALSKNHKFRLSYIHNPFISPPPP